MVLCCCWLLFSLWDTVIVLCFVGSYFMSILVLQSSWWGRESWLICLVCLPGVLWLLWCHGIVCGLWLWYFLILIILFFKGMILGQSPLKVVQRFPFHAEFWLPWQPKWKIWKNLLNKNYWADFKRIRYKCSLGDPLPNLFEQKVCRIC